MINIRDVFDRCDLLFTCNRVHFSFISICGTRRQNYISLEWRAKSTVFFNRMCFFTCRSVCAHGIILITPAGMGNLCRVVHFLLKDRRRHTLSSVHDGRAHLHMNAVFILLRHKTDRKLFQYVTQVVFLFSNFYGSYLAGWQAFWLASKNLSSKFYTKQLQFFPTEYH